MEALWRSILDLLSKIITPDWGELISLLPVALAGLVILWFALTVRGWATVGPARRAPSRLTPIAPPDLHMPGPSYAPIFAAAGAAALLWGLVVGGTALLVGVTILVLALLYWGREAIRDYDQATHAAEHAGMLPAVVHAGPPPGVHMPGPSFRPFLGAAGTTALMAGLVFGGWVLAAGVILLVTTLSGWLVDAVKEYRKTEEADHTGHLENIPDPVWPRRLIQVGSIIFVLAVLLQAGIIPPKAPETAGGGTPSGPAPTEEAPATAFTITAKDIAYDRRSMVVPADTPFTVTFDNADTPGISHDVDIRKADKTTVVQDEPVINGGDSTTYNFDGLPAGTYVFICSIHPVANMTGTLTVK
ncbi:MAG: cupredoxin domain-containing protein [Chloroflexi bacterium]|nr:cupredoxin domain-containing protein [Chloroflexota bacterium]